MQIRDATPDDVSAITAISNQAIAFTTANWDVDSETTDERLAWLVERQAAGQPTIVAADESGDVIGFASYGPFRPRDGYVATVEHSVYVDPKAHGRGIGGALMAELIDRARAGGVHAMVGGIDAANEGSIKFHERLGFRTSTPLPEVGRKFDRWLDLVFVTLIL